MYLAAQIVITDEQLLALSLDRFRSGLTNEQEIEAIRSALETDKAALKALQILLKQSIYSLAILVGRPPETLIEQFTIERPIPIARGKVPAGLPADLLRRRHDIRSAERQLAAATEEVGVAYAALYPSVSLTGSSSSFAANPLQGANYRLFNRQSQQTIHKPRRIWGIGALLTVPVFDFGKRLAGIEVQVALQRQACSYYSRKQSLPLCKKSKMPWLAYFNEEERERSLSLAVDADKRNYDLTLDLFQAGLADFSQVLQAKEYMASCPQYIHR